MRRRQAAWQKADDEMIVCSDSQTVISEKSPTLAHPHETKPADSLDARRLDDDDFQIPRQTEVDYFFFFFLSSASSSFFTFFFFFKETFGTRTLAIPMTIDSSVHLSKSWRRLIRSARVITFRDLIAPARTFKLLSKVILVHIKGKRRPFRPNPEAEKLIFGTNSFQANFGLYFVFRLGFAVS
jgi:hypothetical protein